MTTYLLVHGAMHGGWCWRDVRRGLLAAGHDVFTPSLTGLADRRQLLTSDVGVETHVRDLAELLWFQDLRNVHLVMHSYSAILAGPVVAAAEGRVAAVTYLGGFIVEPGECLLDVEPPDTAARYRQLAEGDGDGWRLPATSAFLTQWGIVDPELVEFVGPRLTDFPLKCQTDAVEFDAAPLAAVPQTYVQHTDPPLGNLDLSFERAIRRGDKIFELACGHDMMLAMPDEVTALLLRNSETSG